MRDVIVDLYADLDFGTSRISEWPVASASKNELLAAPEYIADPG